MSKKEDIINFIKEDLLDDPDKELDLETSLFEERLLDSLNLITLITHLEKTYGIKITPAEVNIDNLDSVGKMLAFLERKIS